MQFEQLLPESQEVIKEFKKFIENHVFKDLSNVLYIGNKNFTIPYKIYISSLKINHQQFYSNFVDINHTSDRDIDFENRGIDFENFIINLLKINYFNCKNFDKIKKEIQNFLISKSYFIKIPNKRIYGRNLCNNYFIADTSGE